MRILTTLLRGAIVATLATGVNGFWRMPCRSRSGLARIDPLVSYNTPSDHLHAIHGSGGFSMTSVTSDLRASSCTSCEVTQDQSAYWFPVPYFRHANGTFELVNQVGGLLAYYLLYPNTGESTVTAFPEGFRMIAGDTYRRNFSGSVPDTPKSSWPGNATESSQPALQEKALGFNCLNYAIQPEGSLYRHFLPTKDYMDQNCKDGMRFELMFPSCWNGQPDSPDHKSHVAYPDLVMTGDCPSGFPTRLPSLFYEVIWDTYAFAGIDGEFVLSNGDPTGCGYHGDFIMGWDQNFLQQACDQCTNASGQIQDCPLFNIQTDDVAAQCLIQEPAQLASEDVYGGSIMPGNPAIQSGPAEATGGAHGTPGAPITSGAVGVQPTLSHSAGVSIASTATYFPGAVFNAVATSYGYGTAVVAAASAYAVNENVAVQSPAPTAAPSSSSSASTYTTIYSTDAQGVLELVMVEEYITITPPGVTTTTTIVTEYPAAATYLQASYAVADVSVDVSVAVSTADAYAAYSPSSAPSVVASSIVASAAASESPSASAPARRRRRRHVHEHLGGSHVHGHRH